MLFSPLLEQALRLAARAHLSQNRKGGEIPYITHPVKVAWMLVRAGFHDDTLLAAALLHDVVEDCGVALETVARETSPKVAVLVAALSEKKVDEHGQPLPWETRKREHLERTHHASLEIRALMLADKLHNLETLILDLETAGALVWRRFNAPPERLLWYYREVIRLCAGVEPALATLAGACRDAIARLETLLPDEQGTDPT